MTTEEAVRAIEEQDAPVLPEAERDHSSAEYLSFISQILQQTNHSVWLEKSEAPIVPALRQIAGLAVIAIEKNGHALGLQVVDREWIYSAAAPSPILSAPRSATEFLLDVESIVLRYKAHRPQMRTPDSAPKVAANLIEIVALCVAALMQHGKK